MAVINLVEAMGTRYIINALVGSFVNILQSAGESGDTVDFAGAKLGPDAALRMMDFTASVNMINSTDPKLNAILQQNRERTFEIEEYEILDLSNVKSIDTFMDLVTKIPRGARVTPKVNITHMLDKVTLILLIMARPDVEFDIRSCAYDIYSYVRNWWLPNAKSHDKYYELVAPDTVVITKDENKGFGTEDYGYMPEEVFIGNRVVLPYEFGNSPIIIVGRSWVDEEWRGVVSACLDCFDNTNIEKKSGKVLRNLLQFREE